MIKHLVKLTISTSFLFTFFASFQQECQDELKKASGGWFAFSIPPINNDKSIVDLSFLNPKPAGEHGFIRVKNGHFFDGRGRRIRFLGTNVTFRGAFPQKDMAVKISALMQRYGINIVRFHHLDMLPKPRGIWESKEQKKFSKEQLDKLDWFIFQLKKHGIYVNLNLHVSRTYPNMPKNIHRLFRFGKIIDVFYPPFIQMQKDYAKALLTHKNPYTNTTYADEPAIAFIEINNENSLTGARWDILDKKMPKPYRTEFIRQWNKWLKKHYSSTDEIKSSWLPKPLKKNIVARGSVGLSEKYSLEKQNIPIPPENACAKWRRDFWRFLIYTENKYVKEMRKYLKNKLKVRSLIIFTQANYGGVLGVLRESTLSDYIDMHAYWQHPTFPKKPWDIKNWHIKNTPLIASKSAGALSFLATHQVEGKPFSLSEYDHPAPNEYVAEMFPLISAIASWQDWDAIYQFNFGSNYKRQYIKHFFEMNRHPAKMLFLPIAALIFRQNAVKPSKKSLILYLPVESVKENSLPHPRHIGYVCYLTGFVPKYSLAQRFAIKFVKGKGKFKLSRTPQQQKGYIINTQQLKWNVAKKGKEFFVIDTPTVKVVAGFVKGRTFKLGKVSIKIRNRESDPKWAVVCIASIDGKQIERAKKILLVVMGKVKNTGMGWNEKRTTVFNNWGSAPVLIRGIPAKIMLSEIKAKIKILTLDQSGSPKKEIPYKTTSKGISFVIGAQHKTPWYVVIKED